MESSWKSGLKLNHFSIIVGGYSGSIFLAMQSFLELSSAK